MASWDCWPKRGKGHVYLSSFVLHERTKNFCLALARGRGLGQRIWGWTGFRRSHKSSGLFCLFVRFVCLFVGLSLFSVIVVVCPLIRIAQAQLQMQIQMEIQIRTQTQIHGTDTDTKCRLAWRCVRHKSENEMAKHINTFIHKHISRFYCYLIFLAFYENVVVPSHTFVHFLFCFFFFLADRNCNIFLLFGQQLPSECLAKPCEHFATLSGTHVSTADDSDTHTLTPFRKDTHTQTYTRAHTAKRYNNKNQ